MVETPLWVIVLIGLIIFSGYMSFRAMRAEAKLEQEYIEKEGKVYMERIEKAREYRHVSEETDPDSELKSFG